MHHFGIFLQKYAVYGAFGSFCRGNSFQLVQPAALVATVHPLRNQAGPAKWIA
jgi:hypothetical protein